MRLGYERRENGLLARVSSLWSPPPGHQSFEFQTFTIAAYMMFAGESGEAPILAGKNIIGETMLTHPVPDFGVFKPGYMDPRKSDQLDETRVSQSLWREFKPSLSE